MSTKMIRGISALVTLIVYSVIYLLAIYYEFGQCLLYDIVFPTTTSDYTNMVIFNTAIYSLTYIYLKNKFGAT